VRWESVLLHIAWTNQNAFDDFGRDPVQLAGAFLADLFPAIGMRFDFCRLNDRLMGFQFVFAQHPCTGCAPQLREVVVALLSVWKQDNVGQTLEQEFQLVFYPVLRCADRRSNDGYTWSSFCRRSRLHLQRTTRAHLFILLKQRDVGHVTLTYAQIFCSISVEIFLSTIPVLLRPYFQPVKQRAELLAPQINLAFFTHGQVNGLFSSRLAQTINLNRPNKRP